MTIKVKPAKVLDLLARKALADYGKVHQPGHPTPEMIAANGRYLELMARHPRPFHFSS